MNHKKATVLMLTSVLPLPGGSGRALRAWDWLQTLAQDHSVHVLMLGVSTERQVVPEDYPAETVWWLADATTYTSRFHRVVGLLFPFLAVWSHRFVVDWPRLAPSAPFLRKLTEGLAGGPVKHVVILRLYLHDVALAVSGLFPDAIMDIDLDDYESHTRLSVAGSLARMGRYYEAAREFSVAVQYWFVEHFIRGRYQTAYLAAEADCHHLSTRLAGAVVYRPNRLDVPEDFPKATPAGELRLMFVGVLNYPPNEEAVRYMVMCILPELRRYLERRYRLYIFGRHASAKLSLLLKGTQHVELIDDADDLASWYAESHIVLVPLRAGGGTKFKTIEGFAHRRPVVSTSHGARGLGAVPGTHYLMAETSAEFALAIRRLALEQTLADRIAEAGWNLWRQKFRATIPKNMIGKPRLDENEA